MAGSLDFVFKLLDQASGPAGAIGASLKAIHDRLDALKSAGDPVGAATAGMGGAGQSALSMGASMGFASAAVTKLVDVATSAASALAGLVFDAAKMTVGAVDFKDNSLIAMDALLKSKGYAENASDLFNNAVRFAGATPFDTGLVVQQTQKLLAAGFKPVELPVVLAGASDLALATGRGAEGLQTLVGAMGRLKNEGKLSGEVLRSFAEAGVGKDALVTTLAKDLGKTPEVIKQMLETGRINAADGSRAVLETIRDNISGGKLGTITEKGSQTFSGLLSSLKSKSLEFLSGINIDPLKNAMSSLANLLDTSSESGQRLSAALSTLIGGAFSKFGDLFNADTIGAAFDVILGAFGSISTTIGAVWPYLSALGGGLWSGMKEAAGPVIDVFKSLFGGLSSGAGPSQTLIDIFKTLGEVLGVAAVIIGAVVTVAGALAAVFTVGIPVAIAGVLNALTSLGGIGASLVDGLWNGIKVGWATMLEDFKALVDLLPAAVKSALGIHSPSLVFAELGMHTAAGFQQGIEVGTEDVRGAVQSMVDPGVAANVRGASGGRGGPVFNVSVAVDAKGAHDPQGMADAVAETITVTLQRLFEAGALELGAVGPNP